MTKVRAHKRKVHGKVRKVKAHRRRTRAPVINQRNSKIFRYLSNPKNYDIEHGGWLDFGKFGKLEQIDVVPGKKFEVDRPDTDFEVYWHTHPFSYQNPPSPYDVTQLVKSKNQQSEVVFRNGNAFTITKTKDSNKLAKKSEKQLDALFLKLFNEAEKHKDVDAAYERLLKEKGFIVNRTKPNQPIKLTGVKVIE